MSSDEDIEAGKMLDLFLANSSEPGFSNYKPNRKDTMQTNEQITEKISKRRPHFEQWVNLDDSTIKVWCANPFATYDLQPGEERIRTREIPCTVEQLELWANGEHIQAAMPQASPDDREFLISGCTPEDWDAMFGPFEDE